MKMITAIAAAALAVCVTLGGCGTKKHETVKPTAAPTATARPTEKTEPTPTPTPLLDTDKTIDDLMDDAEKTKDDVKDKLEGEHDKLQNDLDTGADVATADETSNP